MNNGGKKKNNNLHCEDGRRAAHKVQLHFPSGVDGGMSSGGRGRDPMNFINAVVASFA